MQHKKILITLSLATSLLMLNACSNKSTTSQATTSGASKNIITVDLGSDPATVDPQMSEDTQSHRVVNDLFEGLTTADQSNQIIPGLAEKWDISPDGKTYTFHLRDGIKFSDGTPITADDVVYTYRRLVDPKVSSPYNVLIGNIVSAKDIMKSTKPTTALGVKAINPTTVEIQLNNADPSFLAIASLWNLGIVSQANVTKFGAQWIDPKNMVTSGPYKLTERVVKGHILETKNPNYYDAANVAIEQVKLVPVEDNNSALSQYKSGDLDITYSLPIDQYKKVKDSMGSEEHTVSLEGMYYYDLNMTSAKFKNNPKLRQALSMAVDRDTLVKDVLGQGQVPLYSYATSTIDGGKYAGLDYAWSKLPRAEQVKQAQELFKAAGYSDANPLKITISYNTNDLHKKVTLAIASMWKQVFGDKAIVVDSNNQEWKTFLQTRHKGDYDVARDAWIADYDSIDSYTNLYECNNPQNNSHSCSPEFDKLITEAQNTQDDAKRVELTRQALQIAQDNYAIIPLYQYTYFRLIKPNVTGYTPDTNHLDHVSSKWYKFN
jgi:oligopeptide transport system substrate-binding protein